MSSIASAWLDSMVAVSWEFLLLATVAWLVDVTLLRKASAALRHALWGLVLLRLLVPLPLETPLARAPAAPVWGSVETAREVAAMSGGPARPQPTVASVPRNTSPATTPIRKGGSSFDLPALELPSVLLVAWLGVVLLLAFRQRARRRRSNRARHPPEPRLRELTARAAELVGLRRPPEVLVTPVLPQGPSIEGALRPRVLLPASLSSWPEARLHAVLVHELVHVARRDPLARAIANLIQIAYFFHPAVWLVGARLRSLRERAVDDRVVDLLDEERASYLHALLDFATTRDTPRLEPALGMASRRSPLAARLKRLMGRGYRPTSPTWRSLTMISAFVLAATLLVGSGAAISNESRGASEAPRVSMRAVYPTMYLTSSVDQIASAEKTALDGDAEAGRWLEPSRPDLSALAAEDPELVADLSGRTLRFRLLVDTEGSVRRAQPETDGAGGPVHDALGAHARSLRFEPTRHKTLGAVPFEVLLDYTIDPPQRKLSLLDPEDELVGFEVVDVVRLLPTDGGPGRPGAAARVPYVRIVGKGQPPELHGASLPADVAVTVVVDPGGEITGAELLRLHPRAGFEVPAELEEALVAWVSTFELEHRRDLDLDGLGFTGAVDLRVRDGAIAIASRATADREALAERFAEHYALPEGRVLDLRPPPHDRLRMDFYRFGSPGQARAVPSGPDQMRIHWTDSGLEYGGSCFGCDTLQGILAALGYEPNAVRDEAGLIHTLLEADVVFRTAADPAALVEDLEQALAETLDIHLDLELATEPARSLVFRGSFDGIARDADYRDERTLHVFHDDKDPDPNVGSGGSFSDPGRLVELIGMQLEMPAVDETIGIPQEPLTIRLHRSARGTESIDDVIRSLEEQSDLEISVEERPIEVVRISSRGE